MNAERSLLLFTTVACIALIGWRFAQFKTANVILPDQEATSKPVIAIEQPGTMVNPVTAGGVPMRLVYGEYAFLPPVIPWALNRAAANEQYG